MTKEGYFELLLSNRFSKVSTTDLQTASSVIEQLQGPFLARERTRESSGPVEIRSTEFGRVAISTFAFGRKVDIVPNGLAGAIVVTTAIKGRAGIEIDGNTFDIDSGNTIIAHEEDHPIFLYEPDTEVLKLRFQRSNLESLFRHAYGTAPCGHLHFNTAMSGGAAAAHWLSLLRFVVSTLNGSSGRTPSALELASIEELLMLTLLHNQPHSYGAASDTITEGVSSTYFERAVSYIRQHLTDDITLTDIAKAAYCSPRSLARAFQQAGQTPPMQYVHKLRLQKIRAELLKVPSSRKTIAEIAFQWGYRHLGEFNRQYRATFGETPSATRDGVHARSA